MVDLVDQTPDTGQELYFDAALRHQVGVRRFAAGQVRDILSLLETADREVAEKLRLRLGAITAAPIDFTSERFRTLLAEIRAIRRDVMLQLRQQSREDLIELAKMEQAFETRMITTALPVDIVLKSATIADLRGVVIRNPFSGGANSARTLQQWFRSLEQADQRMLVEAIQLGIAQGETVDNIVRRIVGTRAAKFTDGILATTRRNAETVTRTAINHVSNAAREELWKANQDIINALMWTSTLDGRTSAICRARDGQIVLFNGTEGLPEGRQRLQPQGARPPAHPSCRSVMISIFDTDNIADSLPERATVRDARTRRRREIDFRAQARERAGGRWRRLTERERRSRIRNIRREWAAANVGRVPADVNYNDWLKRQSQQFQEEVLGVTKARLFREGRVTLDQFVDRRGNELTLAQLAETRPELFD